LAEILDRLGARIRPFSNRDVSGFTLGSARDDFGPALDLLGTILAGPDFPVEAVLRERDRALAEVIALRDDTVPFTVSEFFRQIFPGHAYGRPAPGLEEAIRNLGPEDLRRWHRAAYDPTRMVLSVVGDFEPDAILQDLEELVDRLPVSSGTLPETGPVPLVNSASRHEVHKDVSQAVVVLGYPGTVITGEDRYALDVWSGILSGMGNRLFTRLRDEKHLCYFTSAFVASFVKGGAVGAYIGTGPDQVEEATAALLEELGRTAEEPPTEEELRRAQNTLAGEHLIAMQTRMAWAGAYAHDEAVGLGHRETFRYLAGIRRVAARDVLECAERYLDPSRLVTSVLRPAPDTVSAAEKVGA
jgi:zinc protease